MFAPIEARVDDLISRMTPEEAAALAVNTGCDLNCGVVYSALLGAVEKGLIWEEGTDLGGRD